MATLRVGAYDLVAISLGLWDLHDGATHRALVVHYLWLLNLLNIFQRLQDRLRHRPSHLILVGVLIGGEELLLEA